LERFITIAKVTPLFFIFFSSLLFSLLFSSLLFSSLLFSALFLTLLFQHLRELHNYNAVQEILSGLHSSATHRLKKTWDAVNKKLKKEFALLGKQNGW